MRRYSARRSYDRWQLGCRTSLLTATGEGVARVLAEFLGGRRPNRTHSTDEKWPERHILHRERGEVPFGGEIGECDFTGYMNDLRQPENDIEINRLAGLGHLEI